MHASIQFNVDGEALHSALIQNSHKGLQRFQIGDGRFQPVLNHFLEEVRAGSEHQDGQGDTCAAQFDSFHRQGDGQIIGPRLLHQGGEFHGPMPVGIGLHQHQHLRLLLQQGTEIPVVASGSREAQFEP